MWRNSSSIKAAISIKVEFIPWNYPDWLITLKDFSRILESWLRFGDDSVVMIRRHASTSRCWGCFRIFRNFPSILFHSPPPLLFLPVLSIFPPPFLIISSLILLYFSIFFFNSFYYHFLFRSISLKNSLFACSAFSSVLQELKLIPILTILLLLLLFWI